MIEIDKALFTNCFDPIAQRFTKLQDGKHGLLLRYSYFDPARKVLSQLYYGHETYR